MGIPTNFHSTARQARAGGAPGRGQLGQDEFDEAFGQVAKARKFKKKSDEELRDKAEKMLVSRVKPSGESARESLLTL